ncbi:biotin-dependent carboxyltransferase family protein [Mesorhizobium sp. SB112]|uniref:5-oxoprolinase subunit C family protein n=1 Tax=Mesorhizobium sp. SB112 TaxID=3151853 RepID=UPI003265D6B2
MSEAVLAVSFTGPHVAVQDAGRPGYMRFGVPASGPMDRLSYLAANAALGNLGNQPAIEISMGGLALECVSGAVTFAVAGGGFIVEHAGESVGSWVVKTLRAGERLTIRPGHWGSWTYLAFAGDLITDRWLDSASTHALSGFGGGRLKQGQHLTVTDARSETDRVGTIPCPVTARPRAAINVVLGPQDRFFSRETIEAFLATPYRLTDSYDRMGVRLHGPALSPSAPLDMPSEPVMKGSVQVAGDGVPTLLLADHQTTGGYPKIATVLDSDLDALVQHRPRDLIVFREVMPAQAIERARMRAQNSTRYLAMVTERTILS